MVAVVVVMEVLLDVEFFAAFFLATLRQDVMAIQHYGKDT